MAVGDPWVLMQHLTCLKKSKTPPSLSSHYVWSYTLNGVLGLSMLITYLFCITNLDDALNDLSTYPFLWVFQNVLSLSGVNAISVVSTS
ncbi:MAG: hypothetical protein M1830_000237 [Pleopsidium flavum]|nr:MAG: hypothetical protein M1830_000237 [Pleopsidium flavum]